MMLVDALCRLLFLFFIELNQSQRERGTKTLPHPGLIICALGLPWLYLSQPPPCLHLQSRLSVTRGPNDQQTCSVETLWTGSFIKANEPEGKWGWSRLSAKAWSRWPITVWLLSPLKVWSVSVCALTWKWSIHRYPAVAPIKLLYSQIDWTCFELCICELN